MTHISWIFPFDLSGEDEGRQARENQPYFMLKCIGDIGIRSTFVKEVSKNDIPDLTTEGFLYFNEKENIFFVLDRHCAYLLGIFDSEKKRFFQKEIDTIKEKSAILIQNQKEFNKIKTCVMYQQSVQSLLSSNSNEYIISYELLSNFKQKFDELKMKIDYLKKEIEKIVYEYIVQELSILTHSSDKLTKINIEGNVKHYLEFFLYYK
jgi:hypothetical protein